MLVCVPKTEKLCEKPNARHTDIQVNKEEKGVREREFEDAGEQPSARHGRGRVSLAAPTGALPPRAARTGRGAARQTLRGPRPRRQRAHRRPRSVTRPAQGRRSRALRSGARSIFSVLIYM